MQTRSYCPPARRVKPTRNTQRPDAPFGLSILNATWSERIDGIAEGIDDEPLLPGVYHDDSSVPEAVIESDRREALDETARDQAYDARYGWR